MSARLQRLGETARPPLTIFVDGQPVGALQGDTLMVAMLASGAYLRRVEFGEGTRAGFCLMSACQDCWVWTEDGARLRACSTPATEGLRIRTSAPGPEWTLRA
ncbi:MAG: (2Fe-2S)-binding protein [Steroidobacteraceae bacterium]